MERSAFPLVCVEPAPRWYRARGSANIHTPSGTKTLATTSDNADMVPRTRAPGMGSSRNLSGFGTDDMRSTDASSSRLRTATLAMPRTTRVLSGARPSQMKTTAGNAVDSGRNTCAHPRASSLGAASVH